MQRTTKKLVGSDSNTAILSPPSPVGVGAHRLLAEVPLESNGQCQAQNTAP